MTDKNETNSEETLDEVQKALILLSFKLKDHTEERYILNRCIRSLMDHREQKVSP